MNGIDKIAEGIGGAAGAVPEVYIDVIKPSAKETGKLLALIPQTINAALVPLRQWIENKEYNLEATKKLLAVKLEKVSPDDIVPPEPYIAVPALQAISYCANSEELRNMYANLLASSMVAEKKWDVHPSFVEVVKQISPDEAKLLKKISESGTSYPLIDLRAVNNKGAYFTLVHNFTLLSEGVCDMPRKIFSYLDNLARLKIIEIPFGVSINDDQVYKSLEEYSEIQKTMKSQPPEGYQWKIERSKFEVTQYGKAFIEICVKEI